MQGYRIGEVSKVLGISTYTLRYYDKMGLLDFVKRDEKGTRIFRKNDFILLSTIQCLKDTGMHLRDIKHYVDLCAEGMQTVPERLELMQQQRLEVEKQIEDLQESLALIDEKVHYYNEAMAHNTTAVCSEERQEWIERMLDQLKEDA